MTPNRIAVYFTAAAALLAGVAPVVANLDWTSTAGVVAGLAALTAVVDRWLKGWQQFESANYRQQLMTQEAAAQAEAVAQATRPRGSSVKFPR